MVIEIEKSLADLLSLGLPFIQKYTQDRPERRVADRPVHLLEDFGRLERAVFPEDLHYFEFAGRKIRHGMRLAEKGTEVSLRYEDFTTGCRPVNRQSEEFSTYFQSIRSRLWTEHSVL